MNAGRSAQATVPVLTRWFRCLSLYFFTGAGIGLALWGFSNPTLLQPYLLHNKIAPDQRRWLLVTILAVASSSVLLGFVLGRLAKLETTERWAARLAPLIPVGLLPFLLKFNLWTGRELTFLGLCLLCAWSAGALSEKAFRQGYYRPSWGRLTATINQIRSFRYTALGTVVIAALSYAIYFSVSTINNHNNFGTSAFDLGIEDNLAWNAVHFGPLFRSAPLGGSMLHGGFHQTYFVYVLGFVYALIPRAETLLVIQSSFLAAAAIPLFLFARPRLGEQRATLLACLFLLYGPMHGANLYDFHYQPFGVFFILLMAYLLDSGKSWRVLIPVILLTLSVREDMGAMLGALGGYFLLSGKRPKDGLILALVGSTYFVSMKLYIMPHLFMNGKSSFAFMYKLLLPEGSQGFGGVLKTAIGNPAFTLNTMFTEAKLNYLLQIFVPVALLPLRRSLALVLFLPGFVFTLLSTQYPALIMTSFQYTSYWTPMVFLATIFALERLGNKRSIGPALQSAKMLAITVGLLLTSVRYGSVIQVETARGAYDPVHLRKTTEGKKNLADFRALAKQIPPDAKIAASEWLISHLSNRRDAYSLRNGVVDAEYILFWTHPTKFRSDERPVLQRNLVTKRVFGVVEQRGLFVLAKRGHNTDVPLERKLLRKIGRPPSPRRKRR